MDLWGPNPNGFPLAKGGKGIKKSRGGKKVVEDCGLDIWNLKELKTLDEFEGTEDLGRVMETIDEALETTEDHW